MKIKVIGISILGVLAFSGGFAAGCNDNEGDSHITTATTATATNTQTTVTSPTTTTVIKSGFTCVDGTHSDAQHAQGACSRHGGIR